jgi:hypothetical protein
MVICDEPISVDLDKYVEGRPLKWANLSISFNLSNMQIQPGIWAQPVTVCVIRCKKPWVTGYGVAICNPNDILDPDEGKWVAFRRATDHFLEQAFPNLTLNLRYWRKAFGKALQEAMTAKQADMAIQRAGIGQPVQVP